MAEIILPPEEEQEETPQAPELNIDKPSGNSKVITIEFEAKKTNKVSTKDTNQQLYTTDTDAWFEFKETSLEGADGTYSVVFRNRHDGSIFQRTGDVVNGVAYYKIPEQEIRHAGKWRGQLVYTLENGNTTAREFGYDVKGHMLDGKDVREIVVEDFETLMSQLNSMKDNAELELADLEEEYAPKLTEVTEQLAQKANFSDVRVSTNTRPINVSEMDTETKQLFTGGAVAVVGEDAVGSENIKDQSVRSEHLDFAEQTANIFDGYYVNGVTINANENPLMINIDGGVCAIIPIEGGATYHIRKFETSDRLRIGLTTSNSEPKVGETLTKRVVAVDTDVSYYEVPTTIEDKFMVIAVSTSGQQPKMQVTRNIDYKTYIPSKVINKDKVGIVVDSKDIKEKAVTLDHLDFVNKSKNVFDGNYITGVSLGTAVTPPVLSSFETGVTAIFPIEPNSVYHVRKFEDSDRMRIALSNSVNRPKVGDVATLVSNFNEGHFYQEVNTGSADTFMVIQVSASGQTPLMNVTKDTDYDYYVEPRYSFDTNSIYIPETKNIEDKKFFTLGAPTVYFSEQNTIDPNGKNLAYFQGIYDSLESSPMVTPEVRGVDGLGNEIKSYTIEKPYPLAVNYSGYTPYPLDYNKRKKMKIIIIGGVHGNEKSSQVGLSNFIKKLVEDTEDKNLEFIRNNLIIKLLPLANPTGIEANTRANHAGSDLNRDYVSVSQPETRILVDYISENNDAVAMLDYHDSARTVSFWPAEENQVYHDIFYTVMANINDYWTKENPDINNPVGEIVINPTATNSQTFAHNLGMLGIIVESSRNSSSLNGGIDWTWNAEVVKYGNDLLINTILTIMKYYS